MFGLTLLSDVSFPLLVWFYAFSTYKSFVPPKPKRPRQVNDADIVADTQAVDVRKVQRDATQGPQNGASVDLNRT